MADELPTLESAQTFVGTKAEFTAPDPIGLAAIRLFALGVEDPNPHYGDPEFADKERYGGVIAPPTLVCDTMYYHDGGTDEEGGTLNRLRLGKAREVRAWNDYRFVQPVRPTDVITASWTVTDVYEKTGRSGRLLFVVSNVEYTNQDGDLLATNEEAMVYQAGNSEPDA